MSESSCHQPSHDNVDQGLARLAAPLVVLARPAALPEPTQRALHHPPPGQHPPEPLGSKAVPVDDGTDGRPYPSGLAGVANDVHRPPQLGLDPVPAGARISRVHPAMVQPRELHLDALEQQRYRGPILDGGAMDPGPEHQSLGVHHQVALAPAQLLATVVASDSPDPGGLDRLAVDDAGTGLEVTPNPNSEPFPEGRVDTLPGAIQPPEPEVVIDGLPGRELVGSIRHWQPLRTR